MGLLTRKTDHHPFSKDIDDLLDGMGDQKDDIKEGTYEELLKKIEEKIKALGILDEEEK